MRPGAEDKEIDAFVERLIADIVRELVPVRGTPGEQYFAEARKIDTDAIADVLERTDAIGWHPSVLFREQDHALDGRRLGCIVGIMTDPVTAKPTGAISRTYIPEGRKVGKAKTLGAPAGIVRLSEDADVLEGLFLAEGARNRASEHVDRPASDVGDRLDHTHGEVSGPVRHRVHDPGRRPRPERRWRGRRRAIEACWRTAGREVRLLRLKRLGDFNDALAGGARGIGKRAPRRHCEARRASVAPGVS